MSRHIRCRDTNSQTQNILVYTLQKRTAVLVDFLRSKYKMTHEVHNYNALTSLVVMLRSSYATATDGCWMPVWVVMCPQNIQINGSD